MIDILLHDNGNFTNYGLEHTICFLACIAFICYVLYSGKYLWKEDQKRRYVTLICLFGALTQIFKVIYKTYAGIFDPTNDLPLHLCNIMTLVMPIILLYRWRNAWAITFFWIMAGCAQSIFTPTLTESLPHYEAIRYWAVHAVIILGALYGWYVFDWRLRWQDALKSIIVLNFLAAIIYPVNLWFGSNYMYLNGKPPGKTFYDLLGPWPQYIFTLEFVVFISFFTLLLPFNWRNIKNHLKSLVAQKA
ncbi:MAG: TIGR02206 family membrane protein [Saprospiraceae bacterium]|nr:TIGR02206 family membrane protein [Saprospiraceae bacterium]